MDAVGLAMTLMISLLTGCGDKEEKAKNNDTTKVVQVTKVDGTTITADVGELSTDRQEMPQGGETPPVRKMEIRLMANQVVEAVLQQMARPLRLRSQIPPGLYRSFSRVVKMLLRKLL